MVFKTRPIAPILDLSGFGPTMEINAHVISGLDPGAIPGGSTNLPPGLSPESAGPISIDRRVKVLLSLGVAHRFGPLN